MDTQVLYCEVNKEMKYTLECQKGSLIHYNDSVLNEAKTKILKAIDEICTENGLSYFAYGPTLVGAVHYNAFIPGQNALSGDIGLLREDYEKLLVILRKEAEGRGLILDEYIGLTNIPQRLVRLGVRVELGDLEAGDELSMEQDFWILLAPFDRLPDSFDLYCAHLRRMKRANLRYARVCSCHSYSSTKQNFLKFAAKKLLYGWRSPRKEYERVQRIAQKYNHSEDAHRIMRVVFAKSELCWEHQLFPLQKIPFNGMELPCPNDFSPWTATLTPELDKQIKTIQKVDLLLLQEFDRICRKLDIGYFICGGSMLGYVRHGGFIPWDDDIDVGLLRADYDRFLAEGGKELSDRFFLQTRESDPEIPYLFSKIRMNDTEYITEYNENRNFHKGICLDLFPFDFLPDDEQEQKNFLAQVNVCVRRHNKACNKQIAEPVYDEKPKTFEDWMWRTVAHAHRQLWRLVSIKKTQKKYISVATRYNAVAKERGLKTVASFVPTYTYVNLDDLLPYQDISFEGVSAKVPAKPEVFLEMQYHDFMSLPPLHQQLGHDLIRWSADIPEVKDN